ncbi:MAG: ABC transporter permease subunit [Alphaproteobacteria bacterium]|nr:ABC transporter permease subunit [Alphaproteobacteria bacterium]
MAAEQRSGSDLLSPVVGLLRRHGKRLVPLVPLAWLGLFFLLPFAIVLKISLAQSVLSQPPYTPLFEMLDDGFVQFRLFLGNYAFLAEDSLYVSAYLNSLKVAAVSTALCLIVGYPMAYAIARANPSVRVVLLMMVVLPFWTSFLIRVYAWIGILKDEGLINNLLLWLGVIETPITMLNTGFAVYVGLVYSYLPFMVLPLYATLVRLDLTLLEAASDLGCRPARAFLSVTLPLSKPGIYAGALLVFIPSVGEFVIPDLLGGPDVLMIGQVLWNEFFSNRDWPLASAVAVALLGLLVGPLLYLQKVQDRRAEEEA